MEENNKNQNTENSENSQEIEQNISENNQEAASAEKPKKVCRERFLNGYRLL